VGVTREKGGKKRGWVGLKEGRRGAGVVVLGHGLDDKAQSKEASERASKQASKRGYLRVAVLPLAGGAC
jgi:hypothetical protein